MKRGDVLPVTVQGIKVTDAVIEAVDAETATLLIPGTRVVMGITTSLNDSVKESDTEVIVDGVTRPSDNDTAENGDEVAEVTDAAAGDVATSAETVEVSETSNTTSSVDNGVGSDSSESISTE